MPWCALFNGRTGGEGRKALPVLRRFANPPGSAHPFGDECADSITESEHITMAFNTQGASAPITPHLRPSPLQPGFAAHELIIEIHPRAFVEWLGTRAQLEEEGLIPEEFHWPERFDHASWSDGVFDFRLFRKRPPGVRGRKSDFADADYWFLARSRVADRGTGWREGRIYQKRQELAEALFMGTPEYTAQFKRYWDAHDDRAFQRFLSMIPGARKRSGGRPARTRAGGCHD